MAGGQVHAHRRAERNARDVSLLDPDGGEGNAATWSAYTSVDPAR
jgi:hypothetical protein